MFAKPNSSNPINDTNSSWNRPMFSHYIFQSVGKSNIVRIWQSMGVYRGLQSYYGLLVGKGVLDLIFDTIDLIILLIGNA